MPKVPTYDNFKVDQTSMPGQRLDAPITPEIASIGARQMGQLGEGIQKFGNAAATIMIDAQKEANQIRVDDALNQLREQQLKLTYDKDIGFTNQKGLSAIQRQSGKSLTDDYSESMLQSIQKIGTGLGNDAQREVFFRKGKDMLINMQAQTTKHESDEFRDYTLSVREGTIKNRMNEIQFNYNNPTLIDEAVESIKASTYDQAKLLGKSAEWADAQARAMTSKAHMVAVSAAIDKNNIEYAEGYLKKYSSQMDGDDLLRVNGLVTKEMDRKVGVQTATNVMSGVMPKIATSDFDRAFNIAIGTESGGRQLDKDGNPLKSSKGAIGIAQVMPDTAPEAAQLAGLQFDPEKYRYDANYNKALGQAYFKKQLSDFNGNLAAAYAAYNAGPKAVRMAMNSAVNDARIPSANAATPMKSFLDFMPKETQDYVAKNMKAYNSGQGSYEKPTLLEVHNEVRKQLGPDASTDRLKIAIDEATRQYDDFEKALKQKDDLAVSAAMKELVANGGRYSALSPAMRSALPAKEVDGVMNFAQRVAKGDDVTNMALYQKLSTDNYYLKGLSDSEFYRLRAELSEADFKHFSNERGKLISGTGSEKPDDINSASIKSIVDNRLSGLGIDPTPKETNENALMRVAAVRKYVNDKVLEEQRQSGKKMSDADLSKFIDKLFSQSAMNKGGFFGMGDPKAGRMLQMQASDIPSDVRKMIEMDFKNRGIEPTESDILNAFFLLKSKQK